MSWWVLSWRSDVIGFILPVLVAILLLPASYSVPQNEVPLPYYIGLVVMVDVAHVYGTIFRTILDSEATRLNRALFLWGPLRLLLASLLIITLFGEAMVWTLLAYFAMYHFAKQAFGILCLYKARKGERGSLDHQLDYWTCMVGAAVPVALDHVGKKFGDPMKWFDNGEFHLAGLPEVAQVPLIVVYVVVPSVWLARTVWRWIVGDLWNLGKLWIMAVQYLTWTVGVVGKHEVRSLAFVNLFHGVSSMVLVYVVVQRRYAQWRVAKPASMTTRDTICEALVASPLPYVAVMVLFALVEELCWEVCIYQKYLPEMGFQLPCVRRWWRKLVVAVMIQPQLAHYYLDAYIWKLGPQNPGLKDAIVSGFASKVD